MRTKSSPWIGVWVVLAVVAQAPAEDYVTAQRRRQEMMLQRYLLGAQENGPAIRSGTALTALARALAGNVSSAAGTKTTLSAEEIGHLRFRVGGKQGLVLRADGGEPVDVSWWPKALRGEPFDALRSEFRAARAQVVSGCRGDDGGTSTDYVAARRLESALDELQTAYETGNTREVRLASFQAWSAYRQGQEHLARLRAETERLLETGLTGSVPARFDGNTVEDLIDHVFYQGLEFAPAYPADEPTYFAVYERLVRLAETSGLKLEEMPQRQVDPAAAARRAAVVRKAQQRAELRAAALASRKHISGSYRSAESRRPVLRQSWSSCPSRSTWYRTYRRSTCVPSTTYGTRTYMFSVP